MRFSPRLATGSLIGLAALNVVLVGMALGANGPDASNLGSASAAKDSGGASATAASNASESATTPPATESPKTPPATGGPTTPPPTGISALAAPLQTMLVAVDDQRAWRALAGSCSAGGATLETTKDGGATWVNTNTPVEMIARVRAADDQSAFVIGAGQSCVAELRTTTDAGAAWGSVSSVASAWFRDPQDPTVVGGPGASASQPCAGLVVLDLAVLSPRSARVLCADGGVRSTTDTGSAWVDSGALAGAVAMAVLPASPAHTYVVRVDAADCDGIALWRVDQSVATACIQVTLPDDPGQISISLVKGGGWLAVGDTTMRSTDNMVTWSIS